MIKRVRDLTIQCCKHCSRHEDGACVDRIEGGHYTPCASCVGDVLNATGLS